MSNLVPAAPTKPAAPYLGGKSRLAKTIIEHIAATPHKTYAEPFVGMGGVFFRRPFKSRYEVINDLNRDIATFFQVVRHHIGALCDELEWTINARDEFERLKRTPVDTLTDIQRAARFLYIQKTCFGGKSKSASFGISREGESRYRVSVTKDDIKNLHERLETVVIECLPYDEFIRRYDRPETLFYLDPPYYGCEQDYVPSFSRSEFETIADLLSGMRGRALVSLNDTPEIRRIFSGFQINELSTRYSVGGKSRDAERKELLISTT